MFLFSTECQASVKFIKMTGASHVIAGIVPVLASIDSQPIGHACGWGMYECERQHETRECDCKACRRSVLDV